MSIYWLFTIIVLGFDTHLLPISGTASADVKSAAGGATKQSFVVQVQEAADVKSNAAAGGEQSMDMIDPAVLDQLPELTLPENIQRRLTDTADATNYNVNARNQKFLIDWLRANPVYIDAHINIIPGASEPIVEYAIRNAVPLSKLLQALLDLKVHLRLHSLELMLSDFQIWQGKIEPVILRINKVIDRMIDQGLDLSEIARVLQNEKDRVALELEKNRSLSEYLVQLSMRDKRILDAASKHFAQELQKRSKAIHEELDQSLLRELRGIVVDYDVPSLPKQ